LIFSEYDARQLAVCKALCEQSFLFFQRFAFKNRENSPFIVNAHHMLIAMVLEAVVRGDYKRLIINMPPGYTKTEMAVIGFVAWILAKFPFAKFIHASYSDKLALTNSAKIREVVLGAEYQRLWPTVLRDDTRAKGEWYTHGRGGLLATTAKGQITGFRAGLMKPGFSGAFIIDDPIKPFDAHSSVMREAINDNYNQTVKSRLAIEDVPVIVIMQRLHEDDLTGFLLQGGSGEQWHHLNLPVLIPEVGQEPPYPSEYTHGIPIPTTLKPGPLWPYKHNAEQIAILQEDPYSYASQYDQRPSPLGGGIIKDHWWRYYDSYDEHNARITLKDGKVVQLTQKIITADTACKTKDVNDFSVFQCWAKGRDGHVYLLDQERGKWEAPDLESNFLLFCERHEYQKRNILLGVRGRYVEDKVSGTGLIQSINRKKGVKWVRGIKRDIDKVSRVMGITPHLARGSVVLPAKTPWLDEYLKEFGKFTPHMTHKHDDQIDPTVDAIHELLIDGSHLNYGSL